MRDRDKIERIIEEQGTDKSRLVGILQAVQAECNWLPEDALRIIAERLEVPLTDVFGIATFYKSFSLKPRIMETAESFLGIKADETTADYKFTLEGVDCLGCCALGPVMVVGNEYYGNLPPRKVEKILREYEHGDRSNGDRRSERKEEERD